MNNKFAYDYPFELIITKKRVNKHAPGQHDQKTHGGGGSKGGGVSWSKENNFKLNYTENQEIYDKYSKHYSVDPNLPLGESGNPAFSEEIDAVDYYIGSGYVEMNGVSRGKSLDPAIDTKYVSQRNANLDTAIAQSPDIVGDKNLYRVYSDKVLENLEPGDTVIDKGFTSTTRIDITGSDLTSRNTRERLGNIQDSADTMAVIVPSPNKTGKGLMVDMWLPANGELTSDNASRELEVILPRNTALTFIGYQGSFQEKVAIFQRND